MLSVVESRRKDESKKEFALRMILEYGKIYAAINKIFRASVIKKYKIKFDEDRNFAEDLIFVLDYLAVSSLRIGFICEPLYIYNYGTETSTVASSSLDWSNWKSSFEYLKKWVGDEQNPKTRILLKKIWLRWKISHSLAVARSRKTLGDKCKLTNPALLGMASLLKKFRS